MDKIKAIIFDLDGVIVDTARFHYQAWKRLAQELGFYFSLEQNERLKGVSRMESLELLYEFGELPLPSEEEKNRLATKKNDWYRENILKMTPNDILPGVENFLEELKAANYKVAIGSSSKNAGTILEKIGYANFFDAVVDGTKIKNSKPDPEVFLKAANELGINPQNCVVFEDAHAGIEAAKKAKMKTVGVGNKQVLFDADIVVPDLKDMNISVIESLK
ncbi:MAG: beta-phosphoglucomutase [Marinilabiliales bacterium]|nr:MAG: beta-phosphoglucomutase [Marinilabiliales bacterium]